MSATVELYRNESDRYRWQVKNESGILFAECVRNHDSKPAALGEVETMRRLAATVANFQVSRSDSRYRWRLRSADGSIIATSTTSFASRSPAQREVIQANQFLPSAVLRDLTVPEVLYDLGPLPDGLEAGWPYAPVTMREDILAAPTTSERRIDQPNTRVVIRTNIPRIVVAASDVDIQVEGNATICGVFIEKSRKRIRFRGGCYGGIEFEKPTNFNVVPNDWREEWLATDIIFEGIEIDATRSHQAGFAFDMRGKRIAIIRSHIRASRYCVWVGDTATFASTDIILAGNTFDSSGPEATVRFQPVLRSVVVENRLTNPLKHNYRVHGRSDLAFAARNTLIQAGIKLATEDGDDLGMLWVQNNTFHHTLDSLLDLDDPRGSKLRRLVLTGNAIYSDRWSYFFEGAPPLGWINDDSNRFLPYRPFEG